MVEGLSRSDLEDPMATTRLMRFVQTAPAAESPADPVAATREQQIADAAYFRAQARGFVPGHALEDWLEAEREVDARLADARHRR